MGGGRDFESFYAESYRQVVGQVYALVGNLHEAEELSQEAFARAFARWPQVSGYDLPSAWVRRVAFNLASSGHRRAGRRAAALLRLGPPEQALPVSVEAAALQEALGQLPMPYRAVVVLHHLVDLPVRAVAAELGIPEATVKTRLARGRRALAVLLGENERLEEDDHACQ